jgi:stalled ribosome rescue protein Dom34
MTLFHAVVQINHQSAQVLQFDAEQVHVQKVQAHHHDTGQHGSRVRTEHEFFGEVCDELAGIKEVLITGSQTALSDFRRYVEKHRPPITSQILGWETVNRPTDGQLVALARRYFDKHGQAPTKGAPSC